MKRYGTFVSFVALVIFLVPYVDSLAAAELAAEPEANSCVTLLITWLPLLGLLVFWVWFMKRSGVGDNKAYMDRSRAYMDRVEQQNDQIIEALRRVESALEKRQ